MNNPNPYSLRNGLTVAFSDLGVFPSTYRFTVIIGGTLVLGAHELHELSAKWFAEVAQIADDIAREETREELRERAELRRWRDAQ